MWNNDIVCSSLLAFTVTLLEWVVPHVICREWHAAEGALVVVALCLVDANGMEGVATSVQHPQHIGGRDPIPS